MHLGALGLAASAPTPSAVAETAAVEEVITVMFQFS